MKGRCESDRGGDDVYPATFGNEKTGLKLDRRNIAKKPNCYAVITNYDSIVQP